MKKVVIGNGLQSFGDSITMGHSATDMIGYSQRLAEVIQGPYENKGVGHAHTTVSAKQGRQHIDIDRTNVITWMAGLNDIKGGGMGAIPKIEGNLRSFIADCFLAQVVPASLLTRTGTWTSLPNQYGGKAYYHGGNPIYTLNDINASLEWVFEGDNVVVGAYRTNPPGHYHALSISVDSGTPVILELFQNTNETVSFDVKVIKGLGAGQHTLKIMPTIASPFTTVDYVGTLKAPEDCASVFISEIPHMRNWSQYSSIATPEINAAANLAIQGIVSEFSEYPIELIDINAFYDEQTMCAPDGIHPDTSGAVAMFGAFLEGMSFEQNVSIPSWANKVIINDGQQDHEFELPFTVKFIKD